MSFSKLCLQVFRRLRSPLCLLALGGFLCACNRNATESAGRDRWADEPRSAPIIGAYYYPWYWPKRWTEQPVANTPKLGHYSSGDGHVIKQHIDWAKQAHIDFFVASWISPMSKEDKNLKQTLLPAVEREQFKFAILYETPLALGLSIGGGKRLDLAQTLPNATTAGHTMIEHFDYLAASYFQHKSYLRLDDRPVVLVYVVRDLTNAAPYFKLLRERLGKHGINPYLVADVMYWNEPEKLDWAFLKDYFQTVTGYTLYDPPRASQAGFLDAVRGQFRATDLAARNHGLRLIPYVMPGYDDTKLRGKERKALDRLGGQCYREHWQMASEFVDANQPFLFINSFNEWHEGTEVEPSKEYGEAYLTLTHEQTTQLRKKLGEPR